MVGRFLVLAFLTVTAILGLLFLGIAYLEGKAPGRLGLPEFADDPVEPAHRITWQRRRFVVP